MTEAVVLILAAAAATAIAQWARLPAIPIFVGAGAVLAMLPAAPAVGVDQPLPQLALVFLVFAVALEFEPSRLAGQLRSSLRIGLVQFVGVGLLGTLLVLALGFDHVEAVYVGLGLAGSSTIVGVRLLVERGQVFEPFGRLVLGILLLQDLLLILGIVVLGAAGGGAIDMAGDALIAVVLLAVAYLATRSIAPLVADRLDHDQEVLILVAVAVLLGFAGIAWWLHLPLAAGAFLAGIALSVFPVGGMIRAPISSVAGFFSAIFFVSLGSSLELPSVRTLLLALVCLVVVLVATPLIVAFVARRTNLARRESLEAGMLLAQCGELTLVLAVLGRTVGDLDPEVFSAISFVVMCSMTLTPFLATDRVAWWIVERLPRRPPEPIAACEGHVVLLGCGRNSEMLLDVLIVSGRKVVVVDRDPGIVERLAARGIETICGEGSDPAMLAAVHAARARAVISTMRRHADNMRILRRLGGEGGPLVIVRVFVDEHAATLARHGALVVSEAEVAAAEAVLVAPSIARPLEPAAAG